MKKLLKILLFLSYLGATVTDIDGNVYETVLIGDQLWMAENLKVTHYRNGDEIPTGYSNSEWADLDETGTGAYAVYPSDDDDISLETCEGDCAEIYGNLYNWYSVDDAREICPEGWHVPSDDEWTILTDYISPDGLESWGNSIAGGKMKEAGYEHWTSPNTGATNESGFTGFPAGYRTNNGSYFYMGTKGMFWSSTTSTTGTHSFNAWYRQLSYIGNGVIRDNTTKKMGLPIRCIEDEPTTGCTDPNACNYDESITIDDGSCEYEFDCLGECGGSSICGCTDSYADNFNELATSDDGSCTYPDNGDYSLNFDGVDDYIELNSDILTDLNGLSEITIIAMVYNKGSGNDYRNITRLGEGNYRGIMFRIGASSINDYEHNKLEFLLGTDQQNLHITSLENIIENGWTHLAVTYDESEIMMYIDGYPPTNVFVNGNLNSNGVPQTGQITMSESIAVIGQGLSFGHENFFGYIDEIIIINHALSESDLIENYLTGNFQIVEGLIGHWKFDAGSGDILFDHSGNANHGTIHGATWNEIVRGCTDYFALNYNPVANFEDGSCYYCEGENPQGCLYTGCLDGQECIIIDCYPSVCECNEEFGIYLCSNDCDGGACVDISDFEAPIGDINYDGSVDIIDIVYMVNLILEDLEPSADELWAADMNGDEVLNIVDVVLIVADILGSEYDTGNIIDIEFITIPEGEFFWSQNNELIMIDYEYQISKYEITNQEYLLYLNDAFNTDEIWIENNRVMGYYHGDEYWPAGNYQFLILNSGKIIWDNGEFSISSSIYSNHPVTHVSFFGAHGFAMHFGLRIPTAYEWEKAARGYTTNSYSMDPPINGQRANYWWSNDPFEHGTTPVGYFNGSNYDGFQTIDSPSPHGTYDMSGNVYEWVDSWGVDCVSCWWGYCENCKIIRGGSWYYSGLDMLYAWFGLPIAPNELLDGGINVGFRVVKDQ